MNRTLAAILIALAPTLGWAASKNFDVRIDGMTCDHCLKSVKRALEKIPSVDPKSVQVVLKENKALLTVTDEKSDTTEAIKKAIEGTGFKVVSVEPLNQTGPVTGSPAGQAQTK